MGLYADHIFPWLLDHTEDRELTELRRLTVCDVSGDVLEIGMGTGATVPFYPTGIRSLTVVDTSAAMRARAERKAAARGLAIDWRQGAGEHLPLDDGQFDAVVVCDVLCSVDDVDAVLAEAYRVLKPGGRLHFLEHGLAEDEKTRKWQRRLNGFNKVTACGCRLTREPDKHLRASRFVIDELVREPPFRGGTGPLYPHIRGFASKPA